MADKANQRQRPHQARNTKLASEPRIIGGRLRGRRLKYSGDPRTRPMKDRVREAVFNLVRGWIEGYQAVDLFAGTGALGLEAVSRGAARAVLIEKHRPTAAIIKQNVEMLGVGSQVEVVVGDAFSWTVRPRGLGHEPWLVFCSPPFDFYVDRGEEMRNLMATLIEEAPGESVFVVEADVRFDLGDLPAAAEWDIRQYPPAVVGIYHKMSTA